MESVVVRDPEMMSGEPTFRGTRVLVRTLFDYLEAGQSLEQFLEGFPTFSREMAMQAFEEANKRGWQPHLHNVYNQPGIYTFMRTNIVIDDELMRDALRATGLKTKREAVETGLRTLLRLSRQAKIRRLRGKLDWQGDLDAMRRDRRSLSIPACGSITSRDRPRRKRRNSTACLEASHWRLET